MFDRRRNLNFAQSYLEDRDYEVSFEEASRSVLLASKNAEGSTLEIAVLVGSFDADHPKKDSNNPRAVRVFRDIASRRRFSRGDVLLAGSRPIYDGKRAFLGNELLVEYHEGVFLRTRDS